MENIEIWRPAAGWVDLYEVSNIGRLRRVKTHAGKPTETYSSPHKKRSGYIDLWLWRDGKPTRKIAHRLVWESFVGPIPDKMVMNHKNGVRDDNRLENLEVVTQSENIKHGFRRGRKPANNPSKGVKNGGAKLNEAAVRDIRRLRKEGLSQREVAEKYGVSIGLVSLIHRRRLWAELTD